MKKKKQIENFHLQIAGTPYLLRPDFSRATGSERIQLEDLLEELKAEYLHLTPDESLLFAETFREANLFKVRGVASLISMLKAFKIQFSVLAKTGAYQLKQQLVASVTGYHNSFELARSLKRRFVLLLGPTNSGKTYEAMTALAQSKSGAYFAPLRLLALEGQEALFERGVKCDLLTGEERHQMPGANHTSSTIEMLDPGKLLETAVIDEVQLISDPDRGWAWTAAICGVAARTVYLVGSPDCLPWVLPLLKYLQEEIEIRHFDRKSALQVAETPLTALSQLKPGDALIAFTRKDVLYWRDQCKQKGLTCSLVYGSLSPEVRREQARLFQTGQTQILIATDAIGMGLNLPIARIVFTTVEKFDGVARRPLHPWELAQIAGRAGRFGIQNEGWVTCLTGKGLNYLRNALKTPYRPLPEDTRAAVAPSLTHVTNLATALNTDSLGQILTYFKNKLVTDHAVFKTAQLEETIKLAWKTDRFTRLPLAERFVYACAPLEQRNEIHMEYLDSWLSSHSRSKRVSVPLLPDWAVLGGAERFLLEAEQLSKLYSVYGWLCFKFPDTFNESQLAGVYRTQLSRFIEKTLAHHNKKLRQSVLQ